MQSTPKPERRKLSNGTLNRIRGRSSSLPNNFVDEAAFSDIIPTRVTSFNFLNSPRKSKESSKSSTRRESFVKANKFLLSNYPNAADFTDAEMIENLKMNLDSVLDSSTTKLRILIPAIIRSLKNVLKVDKCAIYLKESADEAAFCSLYEDQSMVTEFCSSQNGIVGKVISTQTPVCILNNAFLDESFSIDVDQREGFRPYALFCFPILTLDHPPLSLGAIHFTHPSSLDEKVLKTLESIMPKIQGAIRHTIIRQKIDVSLHEKEYLILSNSVPDVVFDPSIRDSLHASAEALTLILNCERCTVYMVDWLKESLYNISSLDEPSLNSSKHFNGEGFVNGVILTGATANSDSVSLKDNVGSSIYKAKSLLVMPLKSSHGEILGAVEVMNKGINEGSLEEEVHFNDEDENIVELYCSNIANMLEQSLIYRDKMKKEKYNFNKMLEVSAMIADELDAKDLILRVTSLITQLLDSDKASIFLIDEETNGLWSCGQFGEIINLPFGSGIAGEVTVKGQIINIEDAYKSPLFNRKADDLSGYKTKSVLCVPIKNSSGKIVGVAQAINKKRTKGEVMTSIKSVCFDKTDEELLCAVCIYVGITFNNSQLLMHATREKRKSLALLELLQATSGDSKDLKEICGKINLSASKIINAERSALFIVNEINNEFYCPAGFDVNGFSFPFDNNTIVGHVAFNGKHLIIDDIDSSSYVDKYKEFSDYHSKSIICYPCINDISGKVIAVLQLMNKVSTSIVTKFHASVSNTLPLGQSGVPFTSDDQVLIGAMALEVSKALKNVSLEAAYDSLFRDNKVGSDQLSSFISQYTHRDVLLPHGHIGARKRMDSIVKRNSIPTVINEEYVTMLSSWEFDAWLHSYDQVMEFVYLISANLGFLSYFNVPQEIMKNFVVSVRSHYVNTNPYHNFLHGFGVFHITYLMITKSSLKTTLDIFQIFAVSIASLCHDVGHVGVTNQYLINSSDALALRYNDHSVLENMHASLTFKIINKDTCNIFKTFSEDKFKAMRKSIIKCILATDMAEHFDMTVQIKECLNKKNFNMESHGPLLLCTLIHSADISNPVLIFEVSKKWSDAVLVEFNQQAELEIKNSLPKTAMFGESVGSAGQGRLNINFIDYVVLPLWEALADFLPEFKPRIVLIRSNRSRWQSLLADDDPLKSKMLQPLKEEE